MDVKKASDASPPAQGSSMEKNTPRVGEAPSKSNEQQPVMRDSNENFGVKGMAFKRVNSGY